MKYNQYIFLCCICGLISYVSPQSNFTNFTVMANVEDLSLLLMDIQVGQSEKFFPPFHWNQEQGVWPSYVRLNFHGNPDKTIFRDYFAIFDNNMFATTSILQYLLEGKYFVQENWYGPTTSELSRGLNVIKNYHDMNANYSNSLMAFWPQKYNDSLTIYNSYPTNIDDVIKMSRYMPLNYTYEFFRKLGIKDVDGILEHLMMLRPKYTKEFHIPPDFGSTFLNIGLGSILNEMVTLFPTYQKLWMSHNTNLTSVFDALKKYAYRPFSEDQRVNTIDPRSYFYLRKWLQQEKTAGNDVALVPVWIQDTDEVRTWFDKGVRMPFNVNNIDVTVCAHFIYGVTSGIVSGLFQPSLLDDLQIKQIYNDTSRMLAFQIQTNFSDRPELAMSYSPSVMQFYWFVARTYNKLEETLQRKGILPHKVMEQVLTDFKHVLRMYASPRIITAGTNGSTQGLDFVYYDDFVGVADHDYQNKSVNYAEDRTFTTAMALNALLAIWTTQDNNTGKVLWDKDAPVDLKRISHNIVTWLHDYTQPVVYEVWSPFYSATNKGMTTEPLMYPINRLELFNGTRINRTEIHTDKYMLGVQGLIPEEDYQQMMKHIWPHYQTPTSFPGYNNISEFFPFWSSEAYSYVVSLMALARYLGTM